MNKLTHLVCPNCSALNRLKSARLDDGPQCGKCHLGLFNKHPLEFTISNFHKQINKNDIPVLVDFWAPWCGPCKAMTPIFEQVAKQLEPMLRLGKVNTEINQSLGSQYAVKSIPTLILFHKGRELDRKSGVMTVEAIINWVKSHRK